MNIMHIYYTVLQAPHLVVCTPVHLSPRFTCKTSEVGVRAACVCGGVHTPHTCMVYTCVLLYMYIHV